MKPKSIFIIATLILAAYLVLKVALGIGIAIPGGPIGTSLLFFAFGLLVCAMYYGKKDALVFFLIVFVTGWLYETCSIMTGFPFGHYYYSDILGPKLGNVPVLIMFMYFGVGVMSWFIAHILLGKYDNKLKGKDFVLISIISAFVMTMWDVTLDPVAATITGEWVWRDGGPYFGVPLVNFLGWFLCVFTFFAIFAAYQFMKKSNPSLVIMKEKSSWLLPIAGYLAVILATPVAAIFGTNYQITSPDGHIWWASDIRWSMILVATYSMLFVVVLALIKFKQHFDED